MQRDVTVIGACAASYHTMVANPQVAPRRNVQWTERKFIATPMEHGVRFAGTAATTGRLVSEIVTGQPPSIDPTPYRVDRF